MAQKLESLYIDLDARLSGFEKGLDNAEKKLKKSSSNFTKTALSIGAAFTTAGLAGGAALLKIGDDFDKAQREIAVGTGAIGKDLENLKKDFDKVFQRVPDDAQTVAKALASLNTATGATGKALQNLTESVLDASRILGEDAATNAGRFGQVLEQFNVPAEKGVDLMDDLFQITQEYGIGLGDITGQLKTYGVVMQNAGFSVEETAVLMGKMHKAGIDWSRVAPGLNKLIRDMAKEGLDAKDGLKAAADAIKGAKDETEALAISTELFGAEGAQRMMRAIRDNVFALEDLEKSLKNNDGLLEDTEQKTRALGEEFSQMKNELLLMLEPFARDFIKAMKDAIPLIKSTFEKIQSFIGFLNDLGSTIGKTAFDVQWAFMDMLDNAKALYEGVKTWLVDKFTSIITGIKGHIDDAKAFFYDLFDAVVGHSYIPDMVKAINEWMGKKLKKALPDNVKENTKEASKLYQFFKIDMDDINKELLSVSERTWGTFSSGFGDSVAKMVIDGEDFKGNMKEVFQDMGRYFIAALAKMAIEWAAFKVLVETGLIAGGVSPAVVAPGSMATSALGGGGSGDAGGGAGAVVGGSLMSAGIAYSIAQATGKDQEDSEMAALGAGLGFAVAGAPGAAVGGLLGSEYGSEAKGAAAGAFSGGDKSFGEMSGILNDLIETEKGVKSGKPMYSGGNASSSKSKLSSTVIINLDGRQIARGTVPYMPGVLQMQGVAL